jgi:hypothetical protein
MKIFNVITDPKIIPIFYEKTQIKLNVMISYPYCDGVVYDLAVKNRHMIDALYLDSGAFTAQKSKVRFTLSEYRRYIRRYGHLFDAVFTLDDDFSNPDHNFNQQVYLEESLPEDALRPIPVIHDVNNPFEEFESYVEQGHDYIAIGSNKKVPDKVHERIKTEFPDVKIHMFGNLNRKMLFTHKPYSADASTWVNQAGKGSVYYWDPIDKTDCLINLGGRETKDDFSGFKHKAELESFWNQKFGYDRSRLVSDTKARWMVNLYFFKQLEDILNGK